MKKQNTSLLISKKSLKKILLLSSLTKKTIPYIINMSVNNIIEKNPTKLEATYTQNKNQNTGITLSFNEKFFNKLIHFSNLSFLSVPYLLEKAIDNIIKNKPTNEEVSDSENISKENKIIRLYNDEKTWLKIELLSNLSQKTIPQIVKVSVNNIIKRKHEAIINDQNKQ